MLDSFLLKVLPRKYRVRVTVHNSITRMIICYTGKYYKFHCNLQATVKCGILNWLICFGFAFLTLYVTTRQGTEILGSRRWPKDISDHHNQMTKTDKCFVNGIYCN